MTLRERGERVTQMLIIQWLVAPCPLQNYCGHTFKPTQTSTDLLWLISMQIPICACVWGITVKQHGWRHLVSDWHLPEFSSCLAVFSKVLRRRERREKNKPLKCRSQTHSSRSHCATAHCWITSNWLANFSLWRMQRGSRLRSLLYSIVCIKNPLPLVINSMNWCTLQYKVKGYCSEHDLRAVLLQWKKAPQSCYCLTCYLLWHRHCVLAEHCHFLCIWKYTLWQAVCARWRAGRGEI